MSTPLRVSMLACAAAFVGLGVAAAGLSRPEGMIERSYAQAFERGELAVAESRRAPTPGFDPAHLHLSRLPAGGVAGPALAIGDRMTLARRAGGSAAYEVVDVRPLPLAALGEAGNDATRLLLVTAVTSGQMPTETIRFIVDADAPAGTPTPVRPRAL